MANSFLKFADFVPKGTSSSLVAGRLKPESYSTKVVIMSEEKKNWFERYGAWVKKTDRKLFAPIYRTKLGKKWIAWDDSLDGNKFGKLIRVAIGFTVAILVYFGVQGLIQNVASTTYDVQFTQAQKDAGYTTTFEPRASYDKPEDVGYRFFTDEETAATPECELDEYCWDFKLLPLVKNCETIQVKMEFFETDNFLSQPVDTVEKAFSADARGTFTAGLEYNYRLGTKNEKAMYAAMDRAYCSSFVN
jgi:hypothetical protein